ncbi:MAG: hypothetical protein GY845_28630, partial [Planctomycetes bacterium]|nr:hypothetical protein [Planctomycetota bacterium]
MKHHIALQIFICILLLVISCTDGTEEIPSQTQDVDIMPSANEISNVISDNSGQETDEDLSPLTFYRDADGDGFGTPQDAIEAPLLPQGYAENNTDCDDSNASINLDSTEICNDIDDDCDGKIDDGVNIIFYLDADS